mmetsp:Transcript_18119/g.51667  ORF Transcript_18119/g.51667 Transcript_18119/m.51667 type:complete len:344 (-) Transcript_18119:221-1252(-)
MDLSGILGARDLGLCCAAEDATGRRRARTDDEILVTRRSGSDDGSSTASVRGLGRAASEPVMSLTIRLPIADTADCAICLGTGDDRGAGRILLHCRHGFCSPCLLACVRARMSSERGARCPLCRQRLQFEELLAIGMDSEEARAVSLVGISADEAPGAQAPVPPAALAFPEDRRARRRLQRAARRGHWKRCPGCAAIIEKNEGCNHLRCRCGLNFQWDMAECVVPCEQLHWTRTAGVLKYWGTTCPNCAPLAKAKLAAWRASIATVGVPLGIAAGAVTASAVAATIVVPAVVCGVPAVVYEPVRRLRGKRKNPFVRGMAAGAVVAAEGLFTCAVALGGLSDSD